MATDSFQTNLLRYVAASASTLVAMQLARDVFGKAYVELAEVQRTAVDSMAQESIGRNYYRLSPPFFDAPPVQTSTTARAGFQPGPLPTPPPDPRAE